MTKAKKKVIKKKYYREPRVVDVTNYGYSTAFTMRMLNTLSTLKVNIWRKEVIDPDFASLKIHDFAIRMELKNIGKL